DSVPPTAPVLPATTAPVSAPPPRAPLTRRHLLGVAAGLTVTAGAGVTAYRLNVDDGPGGTEDPKPGGLLAALREKGVVRLGIADERPYGYVDGYAGSDIHATGVGPAVAAAVFKRLGVRRTQAATTPFEMLIAGLGVDHFDVIATGLYVTPDRCRQVLFATPHFELRDAFLTARRGAATVTSYADVARVQRQDGFKLACAAGSQQLEYAREAGVKDILPLVDPEAGLAAVSTGRADAFAGTHLDVRALAKKDSEVAVSRPVQPTSGGRPVHNAGAFAFARDQRELRDAFDTELRKIKKSGELLRLVKPFGFTKAEMTDTALEDIC
ncbi:ectoine/hydroxyectoine ABC transporter substrate-binding protein EhuB, partial [Streptomyces boluensis]